MQCDWLLLLFSRQSRLTLCNPMDCSTLDFSVLKCGWSGDKFAGVFFSDA